MRELDFLNIINSKLDDTSLIGDDCAYLEEFGLYVTHDTLVEDVHFSMYTTSPYQLGIKAVNANLSDLAASMAKPLYITVSLSVPNTIKDEFVSELYSGINYVCSLYGVRVAGGDITSSDKIVISISAIGEKVSPYTVSRSFAKKDYCIVTTGQAGNSAAGLYALMNFLYADDCLIKSHLEPHARVNEALELSKIVNSDIAGMDTSDGLIDCLYKIAIASKHSIELDFNKVPVNKKLIEFSKQNNLDYKDFVLWGGEDFELVFALSEDIYENLSDKFTLIGRVINKDTNPSVYVNYGNSSKEINKSIFESYSYNHFKNNL